MPQMIVGLVTIFHVDDYIASIRSLPHLETTRSKLNASLSRLEEDGLVRRRPEEPGSPTGLPIKHLRKKFLAGNAIAQYLAEPRIIHIPDEKPPKAKWKAEFKRNWPDDSTKLPSDIQANLVTAICGAMLQIVAVWRNPTVDTDKYANATWLNVVLSATKAPNAHPCELIRFFQQKGELWAEWEDVPQIGI
jgi:hypothetical protein